MRRRFAVLSAVLLLGACSAQQGGQPEIVNDPCEDPQYRMLKAQPVDSLSQREYEVLREREQACREIQKITAGLTSGDRDRVRPEDSALIEASTTAGAFTGSTAIRVHNKSDVPIMITSIRLFECRGLSTTCGVKRVRIRINPGHRREVFLVRSHSRDSSFRFEYHYEWLEE